MTVLDQIRTASQALNAHCDNCAAEVKRTESTLAETCFLQLDTAVVACKVPEISLGYAKVATKFRIVVITPERTVPWLEATRDLKVTTYHKLPDLLQALLTRIELALEIMRPAPQETKS